MPVGDQCRAVKSVQFCAYLFWSIRLESVGKVDRIRGFLPLVGLCVRNHAGAGFRGFWNAGEGEVIADKPPVCRVRPGSC